MVKYANIKFRNVTIFRVQFNSIKYIYIAVLLSPLSIYKTLSPCRTETVPIKQ